MSSMHWLITELPSLAALKQLVEDLESLANQQVA
jgi:hypothetical protein